MARTKQLDADQVRSVVLNLRVRPALKVELERLAQADQRTLSNWIELLLEKAITEANEAPKR
jgi:predicted HicB family RNase H-like nuclease